jgi:hypothetical protein
MQISSPIARCQVIEYLFYLNKKAQELANGNRRSVAHREISHIDRRCVGGSTMLDGETGHAICGFLGETGEWDYDRGGRSLRLEKISSEKSRGKGSLSDIIIAGTALIGVTFIQGISPLDDRAGVAE